MAGEPGMTTASTTVLLTKPTASKLADYCRSQLPLEACGVLFGTVCGTVVTITDMLPIKNTAAAPHRQFVFDPRAFIPILYGSAADVHGGAGSPVGIFHSHPNAPAVPSPEDLRTAWRDWPCYLIVSLQDERRPAVKAYRLNRGEGETFAHGPRCGYTELSLKIDAEADGSPCAAP